MRYSDDNILLHTQRDTQISRFKAWVLFFVPLAAILFQVYVPLFFQFLAYLELPLIVTVYFALMRRSPVGGLLVGAFVGLARSEEHTSELQSQSNLVCRLLLEKKKETSSIYATLYTSCVSTRCS